MAIDDQLRDMLPHQIIRKAYLGQNVFNEPAYDENNPQTVKARITGKLQKVVNELGEEVVSNREILLDRVVGFKPNDQITLPDGSKPKILAVATVADEEGDYYERVFTG